MRIGGSNVVRRNNQHAAEGQTLVPMYGSMHSGSAQLGSLLGLHIRGTERSKDSGTHLARKRIRSGSGSSPSAAHGGKGSPAVRPRNKEAAAGRRRTPAALHQPPLLDERSGQARQNPRHTHGKPAEPH